MSTHSDPEFDKLRRLLALKRHESPSPAYFDNFLREFHQRQRAEPIRARGWWEQMIEWFRAEPLLAARYALGTALVALLAVNAYLLTHTSTPLPSRTVVGSPSSPVLPVAEPFRPQPPPSVLAERPSAPSVPAEVAIWAPQLASNAQNRSGSHFVLDRVNLAPASYDARGEF